ncbi:MAG: hypothetical protein LLF92_05040 [Planctomycetaceae bacterium]|nr:hypothetical protein [Planctomycetaceae bacterium]
MKKKNPIFFWLWIAVIVFAITGLVKHFHIKNFNVIDNGILYTSGQPRGMDYTRLLYKYHIATFVNLRIVGEHREDNWHSEEVEWMKSNGVKYFEMPVYKKISVDEIPDNEACREFLDIMSDKTNRPVLLHDSTGRNRVSYFAAVWMLKSGNFSLEETINKVEKLQKEPLDEKELAFLKSIANRQ